MTPEVGYVQQIFNRIAPVYDQMNDGLSLGLHRVWKRMAVKWCQPFSGATALDLCCGSGDLARLLAQQVAPYGQVYGVDFSPAQLAIARGRELAFSLPIAPLIWAEADVLALPFRDQTFDCATMGYGLRNVADISQSLRELHRVLKPGARAAILDFHRPGNPQLSRFQRWYLDTFVVPQARSQGLEAEYAYIFPSLEKFPIGSEQVEIAHESGFHRVTHYQIAGGMMGVLVVQKDGELV
ncbi:MAG: bifunctional demethylmenaquinone methyltransferase/2-methoxy-6-polyprenyl-1,4-benzoquinol methylase UbiE [Oscillatoriales cyanobacterium RM2_1_1]|nr:bifunctional demethylmenaquinone methyltransferase/2-methoxy-6-polyprenyl-1,4-benzoquinol methylase UbiE [Oscillatoriales cyanobacterium SM2_3_0]NJO47838.1 bifunctional demethylmenaquinone methyltransferase/2-methoxy-6-polyprenyl-1,4-benzoquinol methylase UbiE [Oscillatoriales cyanobacterium RM2_1_1]